MVWKEINYKNIKDKEMQLIISEVNIMRSVSDDHVVKYHQRF